MIKSCNILNFFHPAAEESNPFRSDAYFPEWKSAFSGLNLSNTWASGGCDVRCKSTGKNIIFIFQNSVVSNPPQQT